MNSGRSDGPESPGNPEVTLAARSSACLEALHAFFSHRTDVLEWGVTKAGLTPNAHRLRAWVSQGYHARMEYMANRLEQRVHPEIFQPWARSIVMFSIPYASPLRPDADGYRIAAYARGKDYHARAREILTALETVLRKETPGTRFYGFVDTAPVFERDLASEAGLGWRGKNTCTIHRKHGSAFHLAGFMLDVDLPASVPVEDFCGGCTRCLEACPTGAFTASGQLDANKCISYWTIEAKGELPAELSQKFGGWIFGCDICQDVCPWNHKAIKAEGKKDREPAGNDQPNLEAVEAGIWSGTGVPGMGTDVLGTNTGMEWLKLLRQGGGFQSRFKNSPLTRAGRKALLRNVAVAAANQRDLEAITPLQALIASESDPILISELKKSLARLLD